MGLKVATGEIDAHVAGKARARRVNSHIDIVAHLAHGKSTGVPDAAWAGLSLLQAVAQMLHAADSINHIVTGCVNSAPDSRSAARAFI